MSATFQPEAFDDKSFDWSDAEPTPQYIQGKNQTIYLRRCFVRVYKSGNTRTAVETYATMATGKQKLPIGFDIFVGGEGGQVKQQQAEAQQDEG